VSRKGDVADVVAGTEQDVAPFDLAPLGVQSQQVAVVGIEGFEQQVAVDGR